MAFSSSGWSSSGWKVRPRVGGIPSSWKVFVKTRAATTDSERSSTWRTSRHQGWKPAISSRTSLLSRQSKKFAAATLPRTLSHSGCDS